MNETKNYDFTPEEIAQARREEDCDSANQSVADGWQAYEDWLRMMREDLSE